MATLISDIDGLLDASTGMVFDENVPGGILYLDGNQMQWITGKINSPMENFIDHFDICGPSGAVIEVILKKKHSERTEKEKEILRNIMREDKPEKPKIQIPEPTANNGLVYTEDYQANFDVRSLVDFVRFS